MDREYYYKVDRCRADSAHDVDCICWHPRGTVPRAHESISSECHLIWRDSRQDSARENPSLIETAPRDGTDILAFNGRIWIAVRWSQWGGGIWSCSNTGHNLLVTSHLLTHWKPMPPAPSREMLAVDGAVENPLVAHAVNSDAGIDVVEPAPRIVAAEAEAGED